MKSTVFLLLIPALLSAAGCAATRPQGVEPGFPALLAGAEAAPPGEERERLVEGLWSRSARGRLPLVDAAGDTATFLYRGSTDSVFLTGDMTGWSSRIPFRRLPGTDLFHLRMGFPCEARLDYKLLLGNGSFILDPENPRTAPGGYGPNSELAMPGFRRAPEPDAAPEAPGGSLSTLRVKSAHLGYAHEVHVYTPPGYAGASFRCGVAYFQDGGDYLRFAQAVLVLDAMHGAEAVPPLAAVFIVPPPGPGTDRTTEYGLNGSYISFVADELVPLVDSLFRTIPRPSARLAMGASYGGLISLGLALSRPDVFANAASQSGYVSFRSDTLASLAARLPRPDVSLYLDCGTYETSVGGAARAREGDFIAGNRRLRQVLEERGYPLAYREFPDGHSWGRWRNELPDILRRFFGWRP
ncbi:MAG: alpha/beta hydrolase-fold protein [Bacteroidota bacterium]